VDEQRFDGLMRALREGSSRRGVLAALGGLGLATLPGASGAKRRRRKSRTNGVRASAAPQTLDPPLEFDLPAGPESCAFPVHIEVTGKIKFNALPGDRMIITAPGENALVTNMDSGKQITLNITGSAHQTTYPNGDVVTVATGRNLLWDPIAEPHVALTRGRFTYAFDKDGVLIHPRSGTGQLTDVCALLS
jgi:hypothetical protein